MGFQHLATSTPFTLNRIDQFRPQPPPPLTSMRYTRDYDEVKLLGLSTNHPNDNTDVARFWAGNFVAQWNETLRQIADAQTMSDRRRRAVVRAGQSCRRRCGDGGVGFESLLQLLAAGDGDCRRR